MRPQAYRMCNLGYGARAAVNALRSVYVACVVWVVYVACVVGVCVACVVCALCATGRGVRAKHA